eukprot:ANDGO_05051.mRNA.1 hypothetical protein
MERVHNLKSMPPLQLDRIGSPGALSPRGHGEQSVATPTSSGRTRGRSMSKGSGSPGNGGHTSHRSQSPRPPADMDMAVTGPELCLNAVNASLRQLRKYILFHAKQSLSSNVQSLSVPGNSGQTVELTHSAGRNRPGRSDSASNLLSARFGGSDGGTPTHAVGQLKVVRSDSGLNMRAMSSPVPATDSAHAGILSVSPENDLGYPGGAVPLEEFFRDLRMLELHVEKSLSEYVKLAEDAFCRLSEASQSSMLSSALSPAKRLQNAASLLLHKSRAESAAVTAAAAAAAVGHANAPPANSGAHTTRDRSSSVTSTSKLAAAPEFSEDSTTLVSMIPFQARSGRLADQKYLTKKQDAERILQASFQLLLESIVSSMRSESGAIYTHSREADDLLCIASFGDASRVPFYRVPTTTGLIGCVFQSGIAFSVEDSNPSKTYRDGLDDATSKFVRSALIVPIFSPDDHMRVVGILRVNNPLLSNHFSEEDEVRIVHFSSLLSVFCDRYCPQLSHKTALFHANMFDQLFPSHRKERSLIPQPNPFVGDATSRLSASNLKNFVRSSLLIHRRKEIIPVIEEKNAHAILSGLQHANQPPSNIGQKSSLRDVSDYVSNLQLAWRKNVDQCMDLQDSVEQSEKTLLYLRSEIRQLRTSLAESNESKDAFETEASGLRRQLEGALLEIDRLKSEKIALEKEAKKNSFISPQTKKYSSYFAANVALTEAKMGRQPSFSSNLSRADSQKPQSPPTGRAPSFARMDSRVSVSSSFSPIVTSPGKNRRISVADSPLASSGTLSPEASSFEFPSRTASMSPDTHSESAHVGAIKKSLQSILESAESLFPEGSSDV